MGNSPRNDPVLSLHAQAFNRGRCGRTSELSKSTQLRSDQKRGRGPHREPFPSVQFQRGTNKTITTRLLFSSRQSRRFRLFQELSKTPSHALHQGTVTESAGLPLGEVGGNGTRK
jgi:hypothetical protein